MKAGERRTRERRCIATGDVRPAEDLVRFVVGPDGTVVPDPDIDLPGRGIWVTATRDALEKACRQNLFSKSAKARVNVPDGLINDLSAQLRRRALSRLGLARRAGRVVAGFAKVDALLRRAEAAVLLEACDGAADGKRKLRALCQGIPVVSTFTGRELSLALGLGNVIHAAIARNGMAERFLSDVRRLEGVNGCGRSGRKERPRDIGKV